MHSVAYDNDESNINNPKLVPATAPAFNLATAFNLFFIVVVVGSHMSPTYSLVVLVFFYYRILIKQVLLNSMKVVLQIRGGLADPSHGSQNLHF